MSADETPGRVSASVPRTSSSSVSASAKQHATPLSVKNLTAGDVLFVIIDLSQVAGHEQGKPRPWVVISDNARLHQTGMDLVLAVPLTTANKGDQFRNFRIRVPASEITTYDTGRLQKTDCLALVEQTRSISICRVGGKVGKVTDRIVNYLRGSVGYLMGV